MKWLIDFTDFCCDQGRLFEQSLLTSDADPPSILIVSTGRHGVLVELALVKACELIGYRSVVLANYDRWTERYYRQAGVGAIRYWDEFLVPCESGAAAALLNLVETFYQFVGLQHGGTRVGKYAAAACVICE